MYSIEPLSLVSLYAMSSVTSGTRLPSLTNVPTCSSKNASKCLIDGTGTPCAPADDVPAKIAQLAELRDQGHITPEEFEAKKAELLDRM